MSSEGETPLRYACMDGHVETARLLIENGADLNVKYRHGYTPLHEACEGGHVETARLLIENGADLNAKNCYDQTPLHEACREGHVETARLLIQNGADVHSADNFGSTPFHVACEGGLMEITRLLFQNGEDVHSADSKHWSPVGIFQMLAHKDADFSRVNKQWTISERKSMKRFTPLHFVCLAGDVERVQTMLLSGESGDNANILSACKVPLTKEVEEMMNKACQQWRAGDINNLYPTSFQEAAEAIQNVFSEESRFQMVASNDTLIVELVLGYCDRSWFQPLSNYSRLKG